MTSAMHSQTRTRRPCRGGSWRHYRIVMTSESDRFSPCDVKLRSIDGFWLRIGWSFLFFASFFVFFVCCLLTGTYKFPFSWMGCLLTQFRKFFPEKRKVLGEKGESYSTPQWVENYEWRGANTSLRLSKIVIFSP